MGQRILLSCERCGVKKEMSVGAGLMSNNPEVIGACLQEEEAREWRQLHDRKQIAHFRAEQKVYYCGSCNELFCRLTAEAELTDGSRVSFGNQCEKCHGELQEVSLEAHHMRCPVCKDGDLSWKQVGFWD